MSRETVTPAEQREALRRGFIGGAIRALELTRRMPELFERRGWAPEPDKVAVLSAAVGCAKIGAGAQVFRLPGTIEKKTADELVAAFDLSELLSPP